MCLEEDETLTTQWQERLTLLLTNGAPGNDFHPQTFLSASSTTYAPNVNNFPSNLYTIDDPPGTRHRPYHSNVGLLMNISR